MQATVRTNNYDKIYFSTHFINKQNISKVREISRYLKPSHPNNNIITNI
jgi:hypothetical protein